MEDKTVSTREILDTLNEVRSRTLGLVEDLSGEQLTVPMLNIVNPPLWEIGHVSWFHERWALRHLRGRDPIISNGDELYDSAAVHHDTRWVLALPPLKETLAYKERVLREITDKLPAERLSPEETYFHKLVIFHEDMHAEAMTYTRQTLGYPPPPFMAEPTAVSGGPCPGDVEIAGGEFILGGTPELPFVFDNEKWGHPVTVAPFRIARAPVTNGEFAAFADDNGYEDRRWWSDEGWSWRQAEGGPHPVYWRAGGAGALARAGLRPMGAASAGTAGDPRQLVRGRGVLPLGRAEAAGGGRVGDGRGRGSRPAAGTREQPSAATRGAKLRPTFPTATSTGPPEAGCRWTRFQPETAPRVAGR